MKKIAAMLGLITLFINSGFLFAEAPPGLMKKGKVPPDFSHGKKVGWHNEFPPGWDKKSEMEQNQWKEAVKRG